MQQRTKRNSRRWKRASIAALIAVAVALPTAAIASFFISSSIGKTTVIEAADGSKQTIYWREYPGTAELDSQDLLSGPTPEQGLETGQKMIAEIEEALTKEFQLQWADIPLPDDNGPFHRPVSNDFGGYSLLTTVNGPNHQSTSVPTSWSGKQRAIAIIDAVSKRYGYASLELESPEGWTPQEFIEFKGGLTPPDQVFISGTAMGAAGQWLSFGIQDLSKDRDGSYAKRDRATAGQEPSSWISMSYGANGLLPAEHVEEFKSRLRPFLGLTAPEPIES